MNFAIRWGGLVLCGIVPAAYVLNVWWVGWWWLPSGRQVGVAGGCFCFRAAPRTPFGINGNPRGLCANQVSGPAYEWRWTQWNDLISGATNVDAPLWMLLPFLCVPTSFAWMAYAHARRRSGGSPDVCPKCGYDRAGIAGDARCPECGATAGAS
jgi:hypothetical protein